MSFVSKLALWTIVVPIALSIIAYYAIVAYERSQDSVVPSVEVDGWWAIKDRSKASSTESKQFIVNASDSELEDLESRLKRAKFLENIVQDHTFGFRGDQLKQIRDYWLDKYKWRKWEREINQMTHYVTQIEGINVHYAIVQPATVAAEPPPNLITIVLLHGWPSTFFEFYKLAQLLVKPDAQNTYNGHAVQFEVIIPSLPGYGWSEAAHKPGMNGISVARIMLKLLARLNRRAYYVHGGDWGSLVAQAMGRLVADKVFVPDYSASGPVKTVQSDLPVIKGVHINLPIVALGKLSTWCKLFMAWLVPPLFLEPEEYSRLFPLEKRVIDLINATGYMHLQATRPDTVAAGLLDSPVGLAAYLLEKYSAWTHRENLVKNDGGLTEKFTLDELLTNVMIYWLSESIGSSVRLYKEVMSRTSPDVLKWLGTPLRLPVGVASFPHEFIVIPKFLLLDVYPTLLHYTDMPRGGHFPALEEPELLVRSIREFVHATEIHWSDQRVAQPNANKA